jgi:hypothetical protein
MCTHSVLIDGYCTSCGLQQESIILCHSYLTAIPTTLLSNKHVHLLTKILHGMNISDHKYIILQEFATKKFVSRLSIRDKMLLCIYKSLRSIDYPIVYSDIEKYSKDIKSKWFKEYKHIPYTKIYISNLVERYSGSYMNSYKDVYKMVERYNNYPVEKVIQAYIYINSKKDDRDIGDINRLVNRMINDKEIVRRISE